MSDVADGSGAFSLEIVCSCGTISPVTARFCASCGRPLAVATRTASDSSGDAAVHRTGDPAATSALDVSITIPHRRSVEERRRVTALFADMSGFTSLAGQLETEDLLAVVDPVITGLAQIVDRYAGYLEKFAGDALLALFGAPVAHEDDAMRALQVAAEMHARIAQLSTSVGVPGLTLHVGVNTGVAVARSIESGGRAQYAVLGESVILAQRLQSLAPAGHTYVGQLTMELTRDQFAFEDVGQHLVKGRAEPVAVYRVLGARRAKPAPATPRLIGRDRDLSVLVDTLRSARAGHAQVAHLVGPAGSGKSHLLAQLRTDPAAEGVLWVEIAGESYAQAAYRSVAPLFAAALAARYPDEVSTAERQRRLRDDPSAPAAADYTALLIGEQADARALGDLVPQEVGRQLYEAAAAWLADLSNRQDLVVAVDNAQWLEPSTIELLAELMWAVPAANVLFCVSGRLAPKSAFDAVASVVVQLDPLEPAEIRELIVDELTLQPDERLTAFVERRSQGNPLMARETIRHLRDEHLLDVRHGHVRLITGAGAGSLPANLETLLAARIDMMPPESISVATAAAAIGLVVPMPLLAAVAGESVAGLSMQIDDLVDAGFVVRPNEAELRFDSPLVRDVLYARLTSRRRQALHASIADLIDSAVPSMDVAARLLAEHRFLAGDARGALPLLRQVAEHSRQLYAHDDAVVALSRAVEAARAAQPPQLELVPDLLCDLGDLRMERGEYDLAGQVYLEAQQQGRDARAFAGYGAALRRLGRYAEAQAHLRGALDAPPLGDVRLVWGELSAVLSVSGDLAGSLSAAGNGLALGRADDRVAGLLLSQMVHAETLLGQVAAAQVHVGQAIDDLQRAGDQVGLCTALRLLGALLESAGRLDEAAATLERGLGLAERIGLVEEIGGCLVNLGLVKGALEDHRSAADCYAQAAVTFERTDNRAGQATAYGNRAYELFMLGETAQARSLAGQAVDLAEEVGNHLTAADVHHTLGLIAESVGDLATTLVEGQAAVRQFELAAMPEAAQPSRELARRAGDALGANPGTTSASGQLPR